MSTPLKKVVDDQLTASGMAAEQLDDDDARYVAAGVKSVLSNLRSRRAWENHIGAILTHKQAVAATGWSKQALSQAVREARILKLEGADGTVGYWSGGLADTEPHVPISGIKDVLGVWSRTDVESWTVASWMSSPQPELDARTPRQALLDGDLADVVTLARQASARLAS